MLVSLVMELRNHCCNMFWDNVSFSKKMYTITSYSSYIKDVLWKLDIVFQDGAHSF